MVIGASIAGLCAARVLSDFYSTVTVFERDELPEAPANRATVPQDRHLHMLMARGAQEFDSLFPGLLHDMVAAGVPMLENRPTVSTWAPPAMSSGRGIPCARSSPPTCPAGRTWNGSCGDGSCSSPTSRLCGAWSPSHSSSAGSSEWSACCWIPW